MENERYYTILNELSKDNFQKFYDIGFNSEKDYSGCGQAMVAPFVEILGINENLYKSASGLLAGISYMGDACGAYVGGVLVLGYIFGREYIDNTENIEAGKEKYRRTARLVLEFREKFTEKFKNINCKIVQETIMGRFFNLLDKEDKVSFEKAGAHTNKCPNVVGTAAQIVAKIIYNELKKDLEL